MAQLIGIGKSGLALDFAKDVHKRCHNAASEALLLDTYGARLESLLERKLDREAAAMMDLVRERYPASRERLREWNAIIAARHGDLTALLEPLNDESLPPDRLAAITRTVRRDVVDPGALADCQTLPPQHSLRIAAGAIRTAFEAVTSGPVPDEALALPEISRGSPLAPWKMLVRAIAAFYRRDDALCEKYLAAVEPGSAAARLAPTLGALIHPQTLPTASSATTALLKQVGGNIDTLRATLKRLDAALDKRNHPSILHEIREAVAACQQIEPDLLVIVKQHISVRAMQAGLRSEKVSAAMGGPSLKNAYFWRLLARSFEEEKDAPMSIGQACSVWEEFRKHAVREGWFPAKGPEVAALYLHMADLLRLLEPADLDLVFTSFEHDFDGHAAYYRGQPAEICALMTGRNNTDLYFLSSHSLLERACEADPCADNFQRWLRYARKSAPAKCDLVAERWSAALPNDIPPLLHLMQSAEKRNALQKAFKLMERAEQIDGLNAEVRRARLRLLVSMAVRHLREKKPKLAEKDLRQIETLPETQQGDRPAFVAALRFVWCILRNARSEAASAHADAVRFLGDEPTAQLLFLEVERWCGQRQSALGDPAGRPGTPLWVAFGRVCALGEDMGMPVNLIEGMPEQLMRELSAPNLSANLPALAALGEAAMRADHFPLAYAISGAGLAQGAEYQAGFLFLRARCLPPGEHERRSSCLTAASELARRQHDAGLLKRIGEWRDQELDWLDLPEQARVALGTAEIGRVVQREIDERTLPTPRPDRDYDDLAQDDEECQCPECCANRGELPNALLDMVEEFGPEVVAQAMAEVLGVGGKKKRRRRGSRLVDFNLPF